MATGTAGPPAPTAALGRVHRYLYEELGAPRVRADAEPGRARTLLATPGDPQDRLRAVRVAGTAGRGSVSAFVASLLRAHGFRVGTHLSLHVHPPTERFQVDRIPVPAELVDAELTRIRPGVEAAEPAGHGRPSSSEVAGAVALGLFADRVDRGVIGTGGGGLPGPTDGADELAVITPIGPASRDLPGATVREIAAREAGVLPVGGRAVAARQRSAEVEDVLSAAAARRRCDLRWVDLGPPAVRAWTGPGGTELHLRGQPPLTLGLTGQHQAGNAHLALRAVEALAARDGWSLDADAVWPGMRRATLPGRFERRGIAGRTAVLDDAHDPVQLATLVATLREVHPGVRFPWVLALEQHEDLEDALHVVAPAASVVVATEVCSDRGDRPPGASAGAELVAAAAADRGLPTVVERDPVLAVGRAVEEADEAVPVVVSGSSRLLAAVHGATVPR